MVASGVVPTYEDMKVDIERIVSMKAGKYKIPQWEMEDIAQEIRLVAFKALQSFDMSKNHKGPFYFIARCVDNYLINLRRDNDAFISKKKLENADDTMLRRLEEKKKILYPASISASKNEHDFLIKDTQSHICFELHERILSVLPSGLHASYEVLVLNGPGSIPKSDFAKIKKIVLNLYGPYKE